MRRISTVAAAALFCAATASAQTKVTGTDQCGEPDPQQMIPVGDRPDHSLGVAQTKCTWTKPLEIGGDKSKEGVSTATLDVSGDSEHTRGFHVTTMESGDEFFVWFQSSGTGKEGKGTWGFTGGTGKLKGIKGKGTYTCTAHVCEIEGEYELAK